MRETCNIDFLASLQCEKFSNDFYMYFVDVLQNNGSSVALSEWRHRRPCYVRENDVREVRRCLVVGGEFGSMLEGKCDVRGKWVWRKRGKRLFE